jgi:hypothetical protein
MKLFGYSISLNVLILIGVLYLIMVVNALSGSCNREGRKGRSNKSPPANSLISEVYKLLDTAQRMPRPLSPQTKEEIKSQLFALGSLSSDRNVKNQIISAANTVSSM